MRRNTQIKLRFAALILGILAPLNLGWAQVSDDVVKLGVLDDMSGPYAENSGEGDVLAVKMAIADFGGKVLGKPIELVSGDLQTKVDVGVSIARKWFDVDHVDAIFGLGNSAVALAVQKIALEKDKISIPTVAASSDLTGKACSPNSAHWVYDTYALAKGAAKAVMKNGGKSWFFVTADYAFGHSLEANAADFVKSLGGKVVGSVRYPTGSSDFSSFLLQAQSSGAQVVAFANAGADTINSLKQAAEFGMAAQGQKLVGLLVQDTEVHALGLKAAQGLTFVTAFYWDQNDETRAFSKRFWKEYGRPPTEVQAGAYSAAMHYLKSVQAAGTDEAKAVMAKMHSLPIDDFMTKNGRIREDGRVMRDMYLVEAKKPEESKGEWDLLKVVATIPAEEAFRPLSESECPAVKQH